MSTQEPKARTNALNFLGHSRNGYETYDRTRPRAHLKRQVYQPVLLFNPWLTSFAFFIMLGNTSHVDTLVCKHSHLAKQRQTQEMIKINNYSQQYTFCFVTVCEYVFVTQLHHFEENLIYPAVTALNNRCGTQASTYIKKRVRCTHHNSPHN